MKRLPVFVIAIAALTAVLAFGAIGAGAHKKKKDVATTVTIAFDSGSPSGDYGEYANGTFSGTVGSTKAKCRSGRTVTVQRVGGPTVGTTQSNDSGNWSVAASNVTAGDQYSVTVDQKKIVKKNKKHTHKTKCQAVSETITIPNP